MFSIARSCAAVLLALAVSACGEEYIDRRVELSSVSGEAVATNVLTHVGDPWPRHAFNNNIGADASRMAQAQKNYRCYNLVAEQKSAFDRANVGTGTGSGSNGEPVIAAGAEPGAATAAGTLQSKGAGC